MKQNPPDPSFSGYSKSGIDFLAELGEKDKPWFDENRKIYTSEVVTPTKLFVTALGKQLASSFAPNIVALPKTNGSIGPINNDLRFSPDKTPYKDHLLLRFWEGDDKKTAPTLMVRISKDTIGFASGAAIVDLEGWRSLIDQNPGKEIADRLAVLGDGRDLDIDGQGYKKVPKPYVQDHPQAELLKHKSFQARWLQPTPSLIYESSFVEWVVDELAAAAEVHHWLVTNLGS